MQNYLSVSTIDLINKQEDGDSPTSSKDNRAIGTPDYMSPEQISGNPTPNHLADYVSINVRHWVDQH
jgi:serine/threonine protein kinase